MQKTKPRKARNLQTQLQVDRCGIGYVGKLVGTIYKHSSLTNLNLNVYGLSRSIFFRIYCIYAGHRFTNTNSKNTEVINDNVWLC